MAPSIDTSSISFTALYTGQVWQHNGLSAPGFASRKGQILYQLLAPFECAGKQLTGANIRTFLLQRHRIIDHLLEAAIQEAPDLQVLEIACGLSPRGYRFHRRYPQLRYIECDLADMANHKRHLLDKLGSLDTHHQVGTLNIFAAGNDGLEAVIGRHFDTHKPLLVITEGLINYFPLSRVDCFWRQLAEQMARFPAARYLSDNFPLLKDHPLGSTMQVLRRLLGIISRSQVNLHFGSDTEAIEHLRNLGFPRAALHNPRDYYQTLAIPRSRSQPLVRIIDTHFPASAADR